MRIGTRSSDIFGCLKHYRRIATRYDKAARNYLGFVYLASTMIWLS